MLRTPPENREHGFTLIELMIGIAIMAIVLALAMPGYKAWIQNTRIRNTAESIQNGLQVARSEAVRRNAAVRFVLGAGSDWTVGCVAASANCPALIQSHPTGEGSSAAIIVTPSDSATIVFNNFGAMTSPTPGVGTFTLIDIDVDPAVLPAAESRELRVTVDVGGNTRMCDPNPALAASDPRKC